jgi:hypothetical protein
MPHRPALATLLLLAVPAVATAEPTDRAAGFAFELRLDAADVAIDEDFMLPGTDAGLFLGWHTGSATFGLGLDLGRMSQTQEFDGNESSMAVTTFLVSPGVRVPIARAADGRTELLLSGDIGLGQTSLSDDDEGDEPEPVFRLRVQAAPALRYWVTPSFAVGATTGIRYDRQSISDDDSSASFATTSLFSSLQLTGVF